METFFHAFTIFLDNLVLLGGIAYLIFFINKKYLSAPSSEKFDQSVIEDIYTTPMVRIKWENPKIEFINDICSVIGKAQIFSCDDDGQVLTSTEDVPMSGELPIQINENVKALELTLHYGCTDSLSYTNQDNAKVDMQVM